MSVEFQVKIAEPIQLSECVQDASKILALMLGKSPGPRIKVTRDAGSDVHATIQRHSEQSLSIAIGEEALVGVATYNFEDPAFQEESGTWLVADVRLRTDLSFVLSLAIAIAVALRTSSMVVDDAGHLNLGGDLNPNDLIERLRLHVTSASLEEGARLLCRSVGFGFGGD